MSTPEPNHGFIDSRRLTGSNRYFGAPAVTLTPRGAAAAEPRALAAWAKCVRDTAALLGWPDPAPIIDRRASGTILVFRSPPQAQMTATELSEWAWERAAAESGETSFERAHDFGQVAPRILADRAAAERREDLARLRAEARLRGLPFLEDDDEISIGAGHRSRTWPRAAAPATQRVPWESLGDVPTVLVTGSNGKTTTVRLLAAMAAAAGLKPGYCSTEGVFVAGSRIDAGDYSGPAGARTVLRHPLVNIAVLETARGGILRRGLAIERADVAVVTNVRADHLGEYGIETAEDLAATKLVVAHAVAGGTLVLNADDATLMAAARLLPHAAAPESALFAEDYDRPELIGLRAQGAGACGVRAGRLMLTHRGRELDIGPIAQLPLTLGGAARYNIANLSAAALSGASLGLPAEAILSTLRRFGADPLDNPGRLERWSYQGATVLLDYAHNPDGLEHLLRVARALSPRRLGLLLGQAGNRDDAAITELGRTAARFAPDRVAIKELPGMLRGRSLGEVPDLLQSALRHAGIPADRIYFEPDEEAAARYLLSSAEAGDVIVLPVHTAMVRECIHALLRARCGLRGHDSNHNPER